MNNKEYVLDVIAILVMTGFVLLIYEMNWAEKYIGFGLIPLLLAYYVGKYVGVRKARKKG